MSERTCETCRFAWGRQCRRWPPQVTHPAQFAGPYTNWPAVHATDWCGEHQPREVADE